nr:DNA polymerase [uncultured Undibacterium sp.]
MLISQYKKVWVADFEFRAADGHQPEPVCLVAKELRSGKIIRLWGSDLNRPSPPFSIDDDTLFVAFYASAEMNCHLALHWQMPKNILDLYAEFRVITNGRILSCGNGLLGALSFFGEDGIESLEKNEMRELVMRGGLYTDAERIKILNYCESDVVATEKLFYQLSSRLDNNYKIAQALLRGRYTKAVAKMEFAGIPIDVDFLELLKRDWGNIKHKLIAKVDREFEVYQDGIFKLNKFADYLTSNSIDWPKLPSGRLAMDDETFGEMCRIHPQFRKLRELRQALGQLRLTELAVGSDGRNRCLLSMFRSKTGRNQPSTSKFIFGLSAWLRGLIKPTVGNGLVYVDWSQQEFGIAAALSDDPKMQDAYRSGDPYLAFAKQAGAVPEFATKATHGEKRELFKACVLAVQYGMGEESLAMRIRQSPAHARELLRMHQRTFRKFWAWSDGVVDYALAHRELWAVFGWKLQIEGKVNQRSIRNFPMQANGAEMLRLACCLATEEGIRVIAPVHDALLVEASIDELETVGNRMLEIMQEASAVVLGGFRLSAEAKYVFSPSRYEDERGKFMWDTVNGLLLGETNEAAQ